ncbi:hypothetical protein OG275_38250 (plasmid) [Streptomyces niveus]|uniref:hypothetical protein n=1 Tax=Streptomyces niveus TaxID=193462 RepID=UPI002E333CF1|nr:hypothetical protein [Streptomyces niveus]
MNPDSADQYAADHAAIRADMEAAVTLDFGQYLGYLANYGAELRKLAAKHPAPEGAFLHLRGYADGILAQLASRDR